MEMILDQLIMEILILENQTMNLEISQMINLTTRPATRMVKILIRPMEKLMVKMTENQTFQKTRLRLRMIAS